MGAAEMLMRLMSCGIKFEVANEKIVVRPADKLTDADRDAIRANKPELMRLLSAGIARPHRLTLAEADEAHREPWDDAAIATFTQRVVLFIRRGVNATDADDLAERLHLREVQGDDRVVCVECRHLAGRRCGNARAAGVGRDMPDALVTTLQRCLGFEGAAP